MHRFLHILFALLLTPAVLAQSYPVDKGSYLLGGTVSFTSEGGDFVSVGSDDRRTTLSINPRFALFVTPGLALGAAVSYSRTSIADAAATSFGIGPELAYFFGDAASEIYPFLAAGVSYTSLDIGSRSLSGFGVDFAGGVVFMVARNVGLTAEAFYQTSSLSELDSDAFGIRGGVTAFIF